MSSLWTPGGEVPIERDRPSPRPDERPPDAPGAGTPSSEEAMAAQAAELQRFLLETPAQDVVAQHAMGLYELAVLHLSQPEPRLGDARLAIDALAALLDGLTGRLGDVGRQLRDVLPQLQMAFVQLADRAAGGAGTTQDAPEGERET
ncbi:MAG TPA: hypothetical protein VFU14_18780 [Acidimicrobiales bacterium]|nr:hypothetical protein [Acidimicrobiales bacterium]